MKIGLDFDGVITDCSQLKTIGAQKLFNISIPAAKFKKEIVVGEGILTIDQYRFLQDEIYTKTEIGLLMDEVQGALASIKQLRADRHDLTIVTSRSEKAVEVANTWLEKRGVKIPIIGVGYSNSKAAALKNMDIYVDDDLEKIEPVINIVKHRYLFHWPYNQHINEQNIAARVYSWSDLIARISQI